MISFTPFTMITLSPFQKKIIKSIGYPLFFTFAFIIFLTMTFPGDRFIPALEGKLSETTGRKVSVEELSVSPFGSVTLLGVRIEIPVDEKNINKKNEKNKDKNNKKINVKKIPKPEYLISELNIDIGLISLLFGDLNIDASFDFLGGNVELSYSGSISEEKDDKTLKNKLSSPSADNSNKHAVEPETGDDEERGMSIHLEASNLNLIQLADLKDILPMPLYGTLSFGMDIKSSNGMLASSEGDIWLKGNGLSIGKGQSKIEILDGMGPMTVDSIGINDFDVKMKISKGKCSFEKFKVVSRDIDITASGDVQLRDPFGSSHFNLYFAFKLLDGYASKSPNAKTLISLIPGAIPRAKRADGYFGFLYSGRVQNAKFRPQRNFRGSSRTSNRRLNRRRSRTPGRTVNTHSPVRRMPPAPTRVQKERLPEPVETVEPAPVIESPPSRLSEPVRPSEPPPSLDDIQRVKAAANEAAARAAHEARDNNDEAESQNSAASKDDQEMEIQESEVEEESSSEDSPTEESEEDI